ncbi:MAG TPA: ferredoxin [Gemmatimonadales bacterium]|nr:ferredoxin [Gemmatimonadales bacterium]
MSGGFDERIIHDVRVRIDRELCVGFGDCVKAAPGAFRLDDEGLAVFENPGDTERKELLDACDACPVDAITVWDAEGRQLVP